MYARDGIPTTAGYPVEKTYVNASGLFDVTSGSNGHCKRTVAYLCTGECGYDGPTGNGSPKGDASPF